MVSKAKSTKISHADIYNSNDGDNSEKLDDKNRLDFFGKEKPM